MKLVETKRDRRLGGHGKTRDRSTALQKEPREKLKHQTLFLSFVRPWLGLFQWSQGCEPQYLLWACLPLGGRWGASAAHLMMERVN